MISSHEHSRAARVGGSGGRRRFGFLGRLGLLRFAIGVPQSFLFLRVCSSSVSSVVRVGFARARFFRPGLGEQRLELAPESGTDLLTELFQAWSFELHPTEPPPVRAVENDQREHLAPFVFCNAAANQCHDVQLRGDLGVPFRRAVDRNVVCAVGVEQLHRDQVDRLLLVEHTSDFRTNALLATFALEMIDHDAPRRRFARVCSRARPGPGFCRCHRPCSQRGRKEQNQ